MDAGILRGYRLPTGARRFDFDTVLGLRRALRAGLAGHLVEVETVSEAVR
jgi:hypothetical protein